MLCRVRDDLPSGTVTFLFTDVEGSTKLLHELGGERYAGALADHRQILRAAFDAHRGVEVDTQGDAFFVAFPTALGAVRAAEDLRAGLAGGPIRVRVGIHTGTPLLTDEGYVGADVHRAARIAASGHGGQVLVSSSTASLVESDTLVDLGDHRLKDLTAPERIYQLNEETFPPLKSLYRTNLPIPATPFLGRERQLEEIEDILTRADVRLLTLTGTGGTGKTRLALQAAARGSDAYPDGVFWVPLATLRDPDLVLRSAAEALGATERLADHISSKRLLLLFDNFEHLADAAPEVAALLAACANLDVLVTSREPLHLAGEHEYAVAPLDDDEAVALFVARARAIDPDFAAADDVVTAICRRLDDLPLAIELAAARVKVLTAAQILERLARRLPLLTGGPRNAPERQQTLRTTIEWSHDLLTEDERRLFARLAVFRGGCTIERAEEIVTADLDTLQSLVDKSLVRRTDARFWMLETIREFAEEQLAATGEAPRLERRHAEHFLALADEAAPLVGDEWLQGGRTWIDLLEREHDELRAALDWFEASGATEQAMRLAGSLSAFWLSRGHVAEAGERLERALRADERPTATRARALNGAADIAAVNGDAAAMQPQAAEALALYRSLGDLRGAAESLQKLGYATGEEGDWAQAKRLLEESNELCREVGDEHAILWGTRTLAWAYWQAGDLEHARELYEETLQQARALGSRAVEAALLGSLVALAVRENRLDDALPLLRESLLLKREIGEQSEIAQALCRAARWLAATGNASASARLLACVEHLRDEIGGGEAWVMRMNDETRALVGAALDKTALADARDEGQRMTLDDGLTLALAALD